jgi:hypothetical protein
MNEVNPKLEILNGRPTYLSFNELSGTTLLVGLRARQGLIQVLKLERARCARRPAQVATLEETVLGDLVAGEGRQLDGHQLIKAFCFGFTQHKPFKFAFEYIN